MKRPTIYLVWMDGEDEQYYNQYFTMADAVSDNDNGDGVKIYSANPKYRGKFKSKTAIVKIKSRKRRNKNGKTA